MAGGIEQIGIVIIAVNHVDYLATHMPIFTEMLHYMPAQNKENFNFHRVCGIWSLYDSFLSAINTWPKV